MTTALALKLAALGGLAGSAAFVHFRGRVRHSFLRQLTDHSTFFAPVNALVYLFSAVPARPFLDLADFPALAPLRAHWEEIRDEALRLRDAERIRASAAYDDAGFNSFFRRGWKRFYLKWYGTPPGSARAACPRTVALVEGIPGIRAAMFALLPAGGTLMEHRDPFAGSIRYHLGLVTPNSDACRIWVDGIPYAWRDGEAVVFDETYVHRAENATGEDRIILFCDVERPLRTRLARRVNRWFGDHVMRASRSRNDADEPVGAVNVAFSQVYRVRLVGKRLKAWSRPTYYAVKFALLGGLLWLVLA
ncbi:aspartyl/asparaginyl beta-hydroxylase domain-containing protein [Anaeromyxobacter oryzae]|uniref:Aspartyl/asparaginyl beta-hydroxylase n=1 Tax=Anaeromyxobacter oryzae TaxID=2918170 RepID=A0ABN6MWJ8_9BACT|nr:aspartyl/asparaginyl beta-hydroxylase domain-containing protein [Anaeromyxobacter oryzae]BDG05327.1 aspartyl/asparaginyl beta-hydroxylase [Anaeromyxobacter oryzae]